MEWIIIAKWFGGFIIGGFIFAITFDLCEAIYFLRKENK